MHSAAGQSEPGDTGMEALEGPEFTHFKDVVSVQVAPGEQLIGEEKSSSVPAERWARLIEDPPR